jgi:aminoglycoside 3-N-acetyltransferase
MRPDYRRLPRVTVVELASDLHTLGLAPGDAVLVHSSLSRIGCVTGGAPAVVEALLQAVGETGTVAAPTFPFTGSMLAYLQSDTLFDAEQTPSKMGAITEAVRLHPRAVRSLEPTHPVAAIGPQAQWLTETHADSVGSCDEQSPFYRLGQIGGKVLLLGVDFRSCTLLHTAEELARVPFIDFKKRFIARGRTRGREYLQSLYCHSAPIPANFPAIEPLLAEAGLLRGGEVGQAECRLFPAGPALELAIAHLRRDPYMLRKREGV